MAYSSQPANFIVLSGFSQDLKVQFMQSNGGLTPVEKYVLVIFSGVLS